MFVRIEMTAHPVTITPDRPVYEAQRVMKENNIRHLPVVNTKGELVGLITRTSLQEVMPSKLTTLSIWELNYELNKIKVEQAMVRDVITTTEDTPIEKAARIMLEKKIGCLPVMRGNRLVGIITDIDLMRMMVELLGAREPGVRMTLRIPDCEGQLARVTNAIAKLDGYIGALGTYPTDDPDKWWLLVKVRHVDKDALVQEIQQLEGIEIVDVRED
jgi:acetoin utilization protein AcuB